jgi:hypothetical protein
MNSLVGSNLTEMAAPTRFGTITRESVVSAILLAFLVCVIFFPLRNYGPQSAVRRFHQAVASQDMRQIAQFAEEPADNRSLVELTIFVGTNLHYATPRLIAVQPDANRAKVLIQYQNKYGASQPVVFFVDQTTAGRWKVNSTATVTALKDFPGILIRN